MDPLVLLLLGIIIGLVISLAYLNFKKPTQHQHASDFAALEAMFEQFMEELEEKQQEFRAEIAECEQQGKMVRTQPPSGKHQKVLDLFAQGKDATSIARQLGIGRGEVDLIIQLKSHQLHVANSKEV